jgi:uncharacterized protein (DUF58 family)
VCILFISLVAALGYFFPFFYSLAVFGLMILVIVVSLELVYLGLNMRSIEASRLLPRRLSNGDANQVDITIRSKFNIGVNLEIIDEIPFQFQQRDFSLKIRLESNSCQSLSYKLTPKDRGEYRFGRLNVYVDLNYGFLKIRNIFDNSVSLKCFPSFHNLYKYELIAVHKTSSNIGLKRMRKLANQTEFDQIKDYVIGDDVKRINWKATARKANLMINQYVEEKSQNIISVIDAGRTMKPAFNGLSLLDYSINSSLAISNAIIAKQDKASMLCFDKDIISYIPPDHKRTHVEKMSNALYNVQTSFPESNYELLYSHLRYKLKERSLVFLYTNFESVEAMNRQLPYLIRIAKYHVLVCVIFKNRELSNFIDDNDNINIREMYTRIVAEKYDYDKQLISKKLSAYGIISISCYPEDLTDSVVNSYLNIKEKSLI